jgi:hypothetical protein
MKKILIFNPYLPTLGGGEKHMAYLCVFFSQRYKDCSIDILVHSYCQNNIDDIDYISISKLENDSI